MWSVCACMLMWCVCMCLYVDKWCVHLKCLCACIWICRVCIDVVEINRVYVQYACVQNIHSVENPYEVVTPLVIFFFFPSHLAHLSLSLTLQHVYMAVYTVYQITQHSLLILFLMTHIDTIYRKRYDSFEKVYYLRFLLFLKNNVCAGFHTQRRTHINTHAHYLKYALRISTRAHTLPIITHAHNTSIPTLDINRYVIIHVCTSIYNTRRRTQTTHQNTRTLDIHIHYPHTHTHTLTQ